MKLTKNILTHDEALAISREYVAFVKEHVYNEAILDPFLWNHAKTDKHGYATTGVKVGQNALTYLDGQFVRVKVISIRPPMHDADGPIVRVSNGEYSWRVDGDKYAFIIDDVAATTRDWTTNLTKP